MEATELRLNNFVIYEDEIVPVMGMENNYNGLLVKIDSNHVIDCKELEPIALTAEWFSRLGFKEAYRSSTRVRFELSNYCRYDFDLSSNKILQGFLFFGNYIKCNYLHQLQNIYFTLTGEELKIKECLKQREVIA